MITSKRELKFYLMADSMMNIGKFEYSFIERIKRIIVPNDILNFMKSLRYYEYYTNVGSIKRFYWKLKNKRIQLKLGFSIAPNVLGYGVVIPHWGDNCSGVWKSHRQLFCIAYIYLYYCW